MLTQQELINRLNQLTLRYNLTWFDIKYDADKAINKINSFLGAKYPKLSDPLYFGKGPEGTYSFITTIKNDDGTETRTEYEIIKEEYFHSVIIPYIAMEILARDEEFTTIYNKYATEMNDGLFDMFQKEFNKVPFEFRQNPDEGVFFGIDTALGKTQHNERNLNIPTFKFRINYYANNNDIELTESFITDVKAYVYDEEATILYPSSDPFYSTDGSKAFTFQGWTRNRVDGLITGSSYVEGVSSPIIKMRSDINLFAVWQPTTTLTITSNGVVSINSVHRPFIKNLIIPEFIEGIQVVTIPTSFISSNKPTLDLFNGAIYLPNSVNIVSLGGFAGFEGALIKLNEGITSIGASAFAATPNLKEIIIPASVTNIAVGTFPVVPGKHFVIRARILEANKPAGWLNGWYAASDPAQNYSVEIIWGYNGA